MSTNQIQVLKQTELLGHQFTVYGTPENPLFRAKDVAEIIEHPNVSVMMNMVDDDEKGVKQLLTPGGNQNVTVLTEDGIYEILMQSRKPIAKQFKKGVKRILHEVRTTGGYLATKPDDTPDEIMARALLVAQETMKKRDERISLLEHQNAQKDETIALQSAELKEAAPKVEYYDEALSANGTYTTMQIAIEFGIGAVTLIQKLRNMGVQYKQNGQWLLYAKYTGKGYTKSITRTYTRSDGSAGSQLQTVWTEKGREFIHSLFHEKAAV